MSSAATNDNDNNNNFLYTFTKNILDSHKSIRWVSIIDQDGTIINEQFREGLNFHCHSLIINVIPIPQMTMFR